MTHSIQKSYWIIEKDMMARAGYFSELKAGTERHHFLGFVS